MAAISDPMRYWPHLPRGRSSVTHTRLRFIAMAYTVLLLLCGLGYALYGGYTLDGDAVAFMDIADAMRAHDMARVVNGYWNPAYAALLALGELVAHPTRWNELQTFFWVNFVIFAGCIAACWFLVRGLVLAREHLAPESAFALSPPVLQLASLALLFASFQRELGLGAVRSDSLLLLLFLLAAGLVLRLQAGGRFLVYPLLGFVLGLAYLSKSFAFLPSGVLLAAIFVFGLTRHGSARHRIAGGAAVAAIVFAAIAGPYIAAISRQRGRLTTGESARLNYAFFVDQTERWHEWHTGKLGHATAHFKHPEQLLLDAPPVYSFAQHPFGTYPLWFDPSYWTDTIQPRFYLKGHLLRLARCSALLLRFLLGHLEPFCLLGVLLLAGCFFTRPGDPTWRALRPLLAVSLWGALMFAIYFPIDLQDRYLTGGLLLILLPVLAMLRRPAGSSGQAATIAVLLLAGLMLANAISDLGERRRMLGVFGFPRGAYSPQIYPAARGLNDLGIGPGNTVACLGDNACYVDHYWARLAGTPIRAEIEVPGGGDPGAFWQSVADPATVFDLLRRRHIAAVVGLFASSNHIPAGWHRLGTSDFYAYPLQPASTP